MLVNYRISCTNTYVMVYTNNCCCGEIHTESCAPQNSQVSSVGIEIDIVYSGAVQVEVRDQPKNCLIPIMWQQ